MLSLLSSFSSNLFAQDDDEQLTALILQRDSLFWQAYNACDVVKMSDFFADNVEFYHDKGGPTLGLNALTLATEKGICGNTAAMRIRREPVKGSAKVFPLRKDSVIYGAILTGEHVFYIIPTGKAPQLDGEARYTHLWLLKDSVWKMSRILSYDHHPAQDTTKRTPVSLPADVLPTYAGRYNGPKSNIVEIQPDSSRLTLMAGGKKFSLLPERTDLFFMKERDLTFEFIRDSNNAVVKLIVRERGEIAEELNKIQ